MQIEKKAILNDGSVVRVGPDFLAFEPAFEEGIHLDRNEAWDLIHFLMSEYGIEERELSPYQGKYKGPQPTVAIAPKNPVAEKPLPSSDTLANRTAGGAEAAAKLMEGKRPEAMYTAAPANMSLQPIDLAREARAAIIEPVVKRA